MKNLLSLIVISLGFTVFAQDTTIIQTFTYDSISTRRAIFSFPEELETKTFEKVLMYYNIKCDPLTPWDSYNCGEWDYLAYSHIFDHTGVMDSVEVEGSRYLVDGAATALSYTVSPYYHYYQNYEKFINYDTEADVDHSIGLGTGTTTAPFGASNTAQRTQVLWQATELTAAGLINEEIAKLRFNVTATGETMGHLTIKMKHTTAAGITTFDNEAWTTVYDRNTTFTVTGTKTINLTYPFEYDGSSDLLLDISFDNHTAGGTDNVIASTPTVYNSVVSTNEKLGHLAIEAGQWAQLEVSHYNFNQAITISFWANGDNDLLPVNTSVLEGSDSLGNRNLNVHFPWFQQSFLLGCWRR